MRLLFSNTYPMDKARQGWNLGVYPAQHLWGTSRLHEKGFEVVDLAVGRSGGRVRRLLEGRLGDLRHQAEVVRSWRRPVVWYTAEYQTLRAILVLRRAGLVRDPVVAVAHDAGASWLDRVALGGADIVVSLSSLVTEELVRSGTLPADRVRTVPWGPDLAFEGYQATGSNFILSSGKTDRDIPTLVRALHEVRFPATIYADDRHDRVVGSAPSWVRSVRALPDTDGSGPTSYDHVLSDLQSCAVVAIPLLTPTRTHGLTELNDALALGKPLVMTRNPYIDCDVEAVGCGLAVDVGDVESWSSALTALAASPQLRAEMGARGRLFAEQHWNADHFNAGIEDALFDAHAAVQRIA